MKCIYEYLRNCISYDYLKENKNCNKNKI